MTQGKQQIAERIEQQGYSYDRIVATRESRQRPEDLVKFAKEILDAYPEV